MTDANRERAKEITVPIHLGSIDLSGKAPGTYLAGFAKMRGDPKQDLFDSAEAFLKAADRCLNGCRVEEGIEMLYIPGTVCASLSCELFFKYILLVECKESGKTHKLDALFQQCSPGVQAAITAERADILDVLQRNCKHFVDARYQHEVDSISFRPQEILQIAQSLYKFVMAKLPIREA